MAQRKVCIEIDTEKWKEVKQGKTVEWTEMGRKERALEFNPEKVLQNFARLAEQLLLEFQHPYAVMQKVDELHIAEAMLASANNLMIDRKKVHEQATYRRETLAKGQPDEMPRREWERE